MFSVSGEAATTLSIVLACLWALEFVCHLQVLTRAKLVRDKREALKVELQTLQR